MATLLVRYLYQKYKERKAPDHHQQMDISLAPSQSNRNVSGSPLPPEDAAPSTTTQTQNQGDSRNTKSNWRWRLALTVALLIPIFLETLDYTVVATAQPEIASTFNRLDLQSYIGTAYLLSSTVFLPVFSSLADIYGRHDALQLALVFFIIGSAISTGAVAMSMMLVGRGVAGIGAAGLLTVVRIILSDARSLDDNNWQQSIMFVLFAIGFSVGPLIGGYLVAVSFRWIFGINLPCCVIAMLLIFLLLRKNVKPAQPPQRLPNSSSPSSETTLEKFLRMDWIGALIFIVGGILLLLALNWGSTTGWGTARVIVSFVIGGILIIVFIVWQYILERQLSVPVPSTSRIFRAEPMIPLQVFRSYDVCAVQYASFVSGMVMLVMFYFVATFMTIVNGLSAAEAGIQLIYFAPGMGAGALLAINAIKFLRQPRYPIIFGSIIIVVSIGLIQMALQENKQNLVSGFMAMAGVGVGLTFGPLAVQARFSQADNRVAAVTGLTLFFRSFGGTVGLAQCAAVLTSKVDSFLFSAAKSGSLSASNIFSLSHASSDLTSIQAIDMLPPDLQDLVRNAFRNGTRWAFISLIPWCGFSVFLALFLSKIPDTDLPKEKTPNNPNGEEAKKAVEKAQ